MRHMITRMTKIFKMRTQTLKNNRLIGIHTRLKLMNSLIILGVTLVSTSQVWSAPVVDLTVITASHGTTPKVSDQLKEIEPRLKASFKRFNQFKFIRSASTPLQKGEAKTFTIVKGLDLHLRVGQVTQRGVTLNIEIPKRSMKHTVKAKVGKLFFEALKWKGQVYLLAVKPKS